MSDRTNATMEPEDREDDDDAPIVNRETIRRVMRDIRDAAKTLSREEARYLVDLYYAIQDYRIQASGQVRSSSAAKCPECGESVPFKTSKKDPSQRTISLHKLADGKPCKGKGSPVEAVESEPNRLVSWVFAEMEAVENEIKKALGVYSQASRVGRWAESIFGIGPVLSAGLLAHIDITKAETAGAIWRFAGLDPGLEWLGNERARDLYKAAEEANPDAAEPADLIPWLAIKANRRPENLRAMCVGDDGRITRRSIEKGLSIRPFNAKLKVLQWKIGESFVKTCNAEEDVYGHVYAAKKAEEEIKNKALTFKDQAAAKLTKFNIGKDTEAFKAYSKGLLPPAHVHARAKRYAVKLFLSHWHHVAYECHHGKAPSKPYIFTDQAKKKGLGDHCHFIGPPNWPME